MLSGKRKNRPQNQGNYVDGCDNIDSCPYGKATQESGDDWTLYYLTQIRAVKPLAWVELDLFHVICFCFGLNSRIRHPIFRVSAVLGCNTGFITVRGTVAI